jgi:hypothetical protein
VFDFSHILSVTEKRVEYDLLGAGPVSVKELRLIHAKLQKKYQQQLSHKLDRIQREQQQQQQDDEKNDTGNDDNRTAPPQQPVNENKLKEQVLKHATGIGSLAGTVFSKLKNASSPAAGNSFPRTSSTAAMAADATTTTSLGTEEMDFATPPNPAADVVVDLLKITDDGDDWVNADIQGATTTEQAVSNINFSIGCDDDDDDDQLFL